MKSLTQHGAFPMTRWSVVIALREGGDLAQVRMALAELCKIYWRPLYSYARYQAIPPADAEDLTQSFLGFALEKELFSAADAGLGRMRNYLLTSFGRHIKHWQRQNHALKRGGGREVLSLEASMAEDEIAIHPVDHRTPEANYQRLCAMRVIEAAVEQLAKEQEEAGKGAIFQALRPRLDPSQAGSGNDAELAKSLGLTHDSVRQAVSRLRKRFREIMKEIVASTLSSPTEESVNEELAALRNALVD